MAENETGLENGFWRGREAPAPRWALAILLLLPVISVPRAATGEAARQRGEPSMANGNRFRDTPEFRSRFASGVSVGTTAERVRALLGEPTTIAGTRWSYYEDRAPRAGEQLLIYVIEFEGDRVAGKLVLGGPDAAGPPKAPGAD